MNCVHCARRQAAGEPCPSPLAHRCLHLCTQVLRDAMLFEAEAHAQAFHAACVRERVSLRGVALLSVDGRFAYNLSGAGAEDIGSAAATYT